MSSWMTTISSLPLPTAPTIPRRLHIAFTAVRTALTEVFDADAA